MAARGGRWLLALAVLVWRRCGLLETYRLETVEYTCESPDLPAAFDGTRIVLVTDIHRGPFFSEERVGRLVDRVNALEPDLVLLGGDYVYARHRLRGLVLRRAGPPGGASRALRGPRQPRLRPPGQRRPGPGDAIEAAAEAGITLLRNQAVWLEKDGQRIRLGGVGDYWREHPDWSPIVEGHRGGRLRPAPVPQPRLRGGAPRRRRRPGALRAHPRRPGDRSSARGRSTCPPSTGRSTAPASSQNEATTVIVSNGIGTSTPLPVRLFAPAQIVVVTLRSGPVRLGAPLVACRLRPPAATLRGPAAVI